MIKFGNITTFGWEGAISGMRNPRESWEKSDSGWCGKDFKGDDVFVIGPKDLELASRLAKAGGPHAKFRRMIHLQMDVLAPMYWWKEFDTYKIGTTANSTSTMNSVMKKEFSVTDFSYEHLGLAGFGALESLVDFFNKVREQYLNPVGKADEKARWWQIIQLLPSGYNQLRTVDMNYEVLANICKYRADHKLDEWRDFCKLVENNVPYAKQLIFCKEESPYDECSGSCETGSETLGSQGSVDVSDAGVGNE